MSAKFEDVWINMVSITSFLKISKITLKLLFREHQMSLFRLISIQNDIASLLNEKLSVSIERISSSM